MSQFTLTINPSHHTQTFKYHHLIILIVLFFNYNLQNVQTSYSTTRDNHKFFPKLLWSPKFHQQQHVYQQKNRNPGITRGLVVIEPKLIYPSKTNSKLKKINYSYNHQYYNALRPKFQKRPIWPKVRRQKSGIGQQIISSICEIFMVVKIIYTFVKKKVLPVVFLVLKFFLSAFLYFKIVYIVKITIFIFSVIILALKYKVPQVPQPELNTTSCICGMSNSNIGRTFTGNLFDFTTNTVDYNSTYSHSQHKYTDRSDILKNNYNFDKNGSRIVNGQNALQNEFPWRASININGSPLNQPDCMGTIISLNFILTSALCFVGHPSFPNINSISVNVGDYDLNTGTEANNQVINVPFTNSHLILHPDFNPSNVNRFDHNIALLRLDTKLEWSENISPICLPWSLNSGNMMTASGWGLGSNGQYSNPLQKVDLQILSAQECRDRFIAEGQPQFTTDITDNMICTFSPGRGICLFDGGTSLDFMNPSDGRYYAFGISNWIVQGDCDTTTMFPQAYTHIPRYLDFIREETQGEEFCMPMP